MTHAQFLGVPIVSCSVATTRDVVIHRTRCVNTHASATAKAAEEQTV